MSKVLTMAQQFMTLAADVVREQARNRQAVSQADKAVSALYHRIEFEGFNAVDGYLLAKQLKEVLRKRREMKRETEILDTLASHVAQVCKRLDKKLQTYGQTPPVGSAGDIVSASGGSPCRHNLPQR